MTVACYCDFCYDDERIMAPVVQIVPHMHKIDRLFTCLNIDYKFGSSYHLLPIACWFSRVVHSGERLSTDVFAIIRHRMTKECGITISPIANHVTDDSSGTGTGTATPETLVGYQCKLPLDLPHLVHLRVVPWAQCQCFK